MHIQITLDDGTIVEREWAQTLTFKSHGVEYIIDFARFTAEAWDYYHVYGKRCAYDGAHVIPKEGATDEDHEKRTKGINGKIGMLYGDRPLRAGRTGDRVAQILRNVVIAWLTNPKGGKRKRKDVPKLGTTTEEIVASAEALKVGKARVKKMLANAEAEAEREASALESLLDD